MKLGQWIKAKLLPCLASLALLAQGAAGLPARADTVRSGEAIEPINAAEITSGGRYVLAIPGINSDDMGSGQFALSSESNGNTAQQLRKHVLFSESQEQVDEKLVWTVEEYDGGYSLKSASDGEDAYLNIEVVDDTPQLTLGPRQALDWSANSDGTVVLSRTIEGARYRVRFTNTKGIGWEAATASSSSSFRVFSIPEALITSTAIAAIDSHEMVSGGSYIFAIAGVQSLDQGVGQFALSGVQNISHTDQLLRHVKFDASQSGVEDTIVWRYEAFEDGYSLKLLAAEGENGYLNIVFENGKAGLTLGPRQALAVTQNPNGTATISRTVDGQAYNVRFTGGSGIGWQASTATATSAFQVFRVPDSLLNPPPTQINGTEIVSGNRYVLTIPGIVSTDQGTGEFALSSESNGNTEQGLRKHVKYDPLAETPDTLVWTIEAYEDGYSLQSAAVEGDNGYLNITVRDGKPHLELGPRQALTLTTGEAGTTSLSARANGTLYYVRFTNTKGVGWEAGTSTSSSAFRIYSLARVPAQRPPYTKIHSADIVSGRNYVLAIPKITYGGQKDLQLALGIKNTENASPLLMQAPSFDASFQEVALNALWKIEAFEDGYSLRAMGIAGNQYLNMVVENGVASLKLGERQALDITPIEGGSEDGALRISTTVDGITYYVRFTGGSGGGYQMGASTSTSGFYAYEVAVEDADLDIEEPREDPLFTIAAFGDMHIDYGIQEWEDVVRPQTQYAIEQVKQNENPDVVLVGGDTLSDNAKGNWNQELYEKAVQQLTAAFRSASKDGKVLYVNGNHDYEAGGTAFNSGAYIDQAMQEGVGAYADALYEGSDRQNNLLAYYYIIDGIHFIGLNTPYNGDKTVSGYIYTLESVEWVGEKLAAIDPNEPVIFLAHYPLQDSVALTEASKGLSDSNGANARLKEILMGYPNVIYLYAHDHGGPFIERDTFERVTAYNGDGTIQAERDAWNGGFTSSYIGSLSYYNNRYNSGALSAAQPAVVQVLMVYVYEDHVDLQMKNYGEKNGAKKNLKSYSVALKQPLTSEAYDINRAEGTITGIRHQTTVEEFLSRFEHPEELTVCGFSGEPITDGSRIVRSDMTLRRTVNGKTVDELTILVNLAAASDLPYTVQAVGLEDADGEPVYAMEEGGSVTAIKVLSNTDSPQEAIAFIGLYDRSGSLLRCAYTPVQGSGTYSLSLPFEELPEGAVYRAVVFDSFTVFRPLSCLLTSDGEQYAPDTVASSADTEMVAGVDQQDNKVVVFRQDSQDWNQESSVVWQWRPTAEMGFTGIETYTNASDAKLRYSDFYGGYVVITTSSGGFVGIVDYETQEKLYSRDTRNENNSHSVELLPDGNLAVAASTGNSVTIYAASQGDGSGYYARYTLEDAHGLAWDPDLQVLWALGGKELVAYGLGGTTEEPALVLREDLVFDLPTAGGHDLYPVYGDTDRLWVTTVTDVYQFDTRTGEFLTGYDSYGAISSPNIKSVGNQPYSGTIVRAIPNGTMAEWNTNTVDLFAPDGQGGYLADTRVHNHDAYYKVRAWYYKYQ
ncbi:MAG TPA: metallophosphoesterase [Firmicutes bacterium]|nr:metallophosphoesterase [Bacillota bacterium]